MTSKDQTYYIERFQKLRVNHSKGKAPYQPLLILSIIEMIEQRLIHENKFYLSPELIAIFIKYRNHLSSSHYQANIAQPFYHMSKPKNTFWHLMPRLGHEEVLLSGGRLNTLEKLRINVDYGYLDSELFQLLQSDYSRNILTGVVVNKWFPEKLDTLGQLLKIRSFEELKALLKDSGGAIYSVDEVKDSVENELRNAAFRKNLIALYDQRCAFCRLKILGHNQDNIVDGAHIKPFALFRDNRYTNGLALCKNHHWAFDRGWFGISNDYRILIPNDRIYEETPNNSSGMKDYANSKIFLPSQSAFRPSVESLTWHREKWSIAS